MHLSLSTQLAVFIQYTPLKLLLYAVLFTTHVECIMISTVACKVKMFLTVCTQNTVAFIYSVTRHTKYVRLL